MRKLVVLLVGLTMACGAAAGITVNLARTFADDSSKGYKNCGKYNFSSEIWLRAIERNIAERPTY